MNYYEHHIGDYAKDAGHLSLVEDGAYRRLLDAYYGREKPLPGDIKECCKLARATTKPERDAVAYVLREFFALRDGGHIQGRADKEIARFQDKQEKARRSANARWSNAETHSEGNANASPNASPNAMRTHSEGNAPRARPQSPVTSNQEKQKQKIAPDGELFDGIDPTVAADFRALRAKQRAPVTKTAMAGIRREATAAGLTAQQALAMCCERGWRGFKADWLTDAKGRPQAGGYQPLPGEV